MSVRRKWRRWVNSRKFVRVGKRCSLDGHSLEIDGHVELEDYCKVRSNTIMRTNGGGKILIGTYSGISYNCFLEARTIIQIGRYTGIAEFTIIRDTNHAVIGTSDHWRTTPYISQPIVIGNACLIGSGCYISPGVAIGDGAVIAQHSVITRDVGPFEIWSGNPARKVAHRIHGIPDSTKKRYQELLNTYGIKDARHGFKEQAAEVRDAVNLEGNRAAEERDQLMAMFAASSPREEK
ncbi:MAG: hypothetical protein KAH38_10145 [Candidatus Hydrogenedentes bacterium]|nr:hypothetical protein [Candidatus Hydrogenedentota bacterium]